MFIFYYTITGKLSNKPKQPAHGSKADQAHPPCIAGTYRVGDIVSPFPTFPRRGGESLISECCNLITHNGYTVVDEMHHYRNPEASCPYEDIAEQRAHHHSWDKAVKLHMYSREDKSRHPNSYMSVALRAEDSLQHTAERHLFRERRQQRHQAEIEEQATYAVCR